MFRIGSPARWFQVLALALVTLAVPARAFAQVPTFNTVIATPTGSQPWQPPRPAAVGDFNGDGKLDALIVDGTSSVRFLRGNGNSTFARTDIGIPFITASNVVDLPPSLAPYLPNALDGYIAVRAADVNGDGKLDAICGTGAHINWGPYNFVSVLINTGNDGSGVPQFADAHYFLPFTDIRSMTVGDLNGDGNGDFIVSGAYGQQQIYLSNGPGTFARGQATYLSTASASTGPGVIRDLNGDGQADFVVTTNQGNGTTDIFFGNGNGTLQTPASIPNIYAVALAVADVNNDGKPDLVEGFGDGSVSVFLNNGNGTFGSQASFPTVAGGGASGFFMSDVNGDGNMDVAMSLYSAGKVAILLGNGDGTFGASYLYSGMPNAVDVTLADFTGDGKPEIASVSAAGYGGQNFDVLTNTTVFTPPLPTQTLTILGGDGGVGGIAANVEYYNAATGVWQQAYLTGGHPWGFVPGTNSWINYKVSNLSDPGAGPTTNQTRWYLYRVRFTVPADAINPKMTFSLKADNFAQVAINGATAGGTTQFINNAWMNNVVVGTADQVNVDAAFSQNVHVGENTITLNIGDWGGLNGFNFRIDLSMQSSQPLEIVPPASADNTPPVITAPADITEEATSAAGAVVNFTATAADDVNGAVAVEADPPSGSTFAFGVTNVHLTATDAAGNEALASFGVTVRDTIAPAITSVPANQTIEATSAAGATAIFGAAVATDAVGVTSLTYSTASGSTFPIGTTTVTVTAADAAGHLSHATFTVTVQDTIAPAIATVTPSQATIWPPNHKMVAITVNATATDAVGVASLKIISATSSEPDNGLGDGDTAGDIQVTGDLTLNLRAERAGKGNGRTYTITVEARDAAGNASTKTCTVFVPKSQGDNDRDDNDRDDDDRDGDHGKKDDRNKKDKDKKDKDGKKS